MAASHTTGSRRTITQYRSRVFLSLQQNNDNNNNNAELAASNKVVKYAGCQSMPAVLVAEHITSYYTALAVSSHGSGHL